MGILEEDGGLLAGFESFKIFNKYINLFLTMYYIFDTKVQSLKLSSLKLLY